MATDAAVRPAPRRAASRPTRHLPTGAAVTRYRPDIDGLRSLAVLSVVLYHFGFARMGGGYVGVDVFFVISGFLIGPQVIDAVAERRFSPAAFFERRIRRLYPALFITIAATLVAAGWIFLPADYRSFGKSVIATLAYASNIFFYHETGYFDPGAATKPLLHSWSLAVEEQFYIALPLAAALMAALGVGRRLLRGVLLALGGLSLLFAAAQVRDDPAAAFFLFPARFWEMMLGVATAYARPRTPLAPWAATLLGLAGLLMILGPVAIYDHGTRFPGLAAVPPCLGSALLILAGGTAANPVSRGFAARPLVAIGAISYSIYLIHWPVMVLMTYWYEGELSLARRLAGVAATVALAALSWRFVEQPFRNPRFLTRAQLFAMAAAGSTALMAAGMVLWRTDGLPQRYPPAGRALAYAAGDFLQNGGVCDQRPIDLSPGLIVCRIGRLDRPPTALVWGDSHARALRDGLDLRARELGVSAILVWQGGCPPLFDVTKTESTPRTDRECAEATQRLRAWLRRDRTLDSVLLIGRWAYYTEGRGVGADAQNHMAIRSALTPGDDTRRIFAAALDRTVDELRGEGRRVFVLAPIPEIDNFNGRAIAQPVLTGRRPLAELLAERGSVPRARVDAREHAALTAIDALAAAGKARPLSLRDIFCDARRCSGWIGGNAVFFDNNHLTVTMSLRLRDRFDPFLAAAVPAPPATLLGLPVVGG